MMQTRIVIAAAAAAVGVLFAAPAVTTATPLTPIGAETQLTTIVKQSSAIEQAAKRHKKKYAGKRFSNKKYAGKRYYNRGYSGKRYNNKNRYAYRYPRYRNRYGGCWNCGYRRYGAPFFFSFGYPYYPYYYGYPYYGGYYGPSVGFGFMIN